MTPYPQIHTGREEWRWSWRDALRLWRYNWIKRPWRNLLWSLPWGHGAAFRREHPNSPFAHIRPTAGKMTRADMEWAYEVARTLPPPSSVEGGDA